MHNCKEILVATIIFHFMIKPAASFSMEKTVKPRANVGVVPRHVTIYWGVSASQGGPGNLVSRTWMNANLIHALAITTSA